MNEVVNIKDIRIDKAIRQKLNKMSGPIFREECREIGDLFVSDPLDDLEDLLCCTGLKSLDICGYFTSLAPLSNLKSLEKLTIRRTPANGQNYRSSNRFVDLKELAEIKSLSNFSFEPASLKELESLQYLEQLQSLKIIPRRVRIHDLSFLSQLLNLHTLILGGHMIQNFNVLGQIKQLEVLWLQDNIISDIQILENLENLKELRLDNESKPLNERDQMMKNHIGKIDALAHCHSLERLYLKYNPVTNLSPLAQLSQLGFLDLSYFDFRNRLSVPFLMHIGEQHQNGMRLEGMLRECINSNEIPRVYFKDAEESDEIVDIEDPAFEKLIRHDIMLAEGPLRKRDLARITSFKFQYGCGVKDISCIEHMVHLTELEIINAGINDIGPLGKLSNLQKLEINDKNVSFSNLDLLEKNRYLKVLKLNDLGISDISALLKYPLLEILDLSRNCIESIQPLSGLDKLRELFLSHNKLIDLSPLKGHCKLETLSLSSNQITDIEPLAELSELKKLFLEDNQVREISSLSRLTELEVLFLNYNRIDDISSLATLSQLQNLGLANNHIKNISALKELSRVQRLNIKDNPIQSWIPLLYPHQLFTRLELDLKLNLEDFSSVPLPHQCLSGLMLTRDNFKKEYLVIDLYARDVKRNWQDIHDYFNGDLKIFYSALCDHYDLYEKTKNQEKNIYNMMLREFKRNYPEYTDSTKKETGELKSGNSFQNKISEENEKSQQEKNQFDGKFFFRQDEYWIIKQEDNFLSLIHGYEKARDYIYEKRRYKTMSLAEAETRKFISRLLSNNFIHKKQCPEVGRFKRSLHEYRKKLHGYTYFENEAEGTCWAVSREKLEPGGQYPPAFFKKSGLVPYGLNKTDMYPYWENETYAMLVEKIQKKGFIEKPVNSITLEPVPPNVEIEVPNDRYGIFTKDINEERKETPKKTRNEEPDPLVKNWPACITTRKPLRVNTDTAPAFLWEAYELGEYEEGLNFLANWKIPIKNVVFLGGCPASLYRECPNVPEHHQNQISEKLDMAVSRYLWSDFDLISGDHQIIPLRVVYNYGDGDTNDGMWGAFWQRDTGEKVADIMSTGDMETTIQASKFRDYIEHEIWLPVRFLNERPRFKYAANQELEKLLGLAIVLCETAYNISRSV